MEEPVSRLMGKYAVPCIISLLVGALYNIVDQIFIANAAYLGFLNHRVMLHVPLESGHGTLYLSVPSVTT